MNSGMAFVSVKVFLKIGLGRISNPTTEAGSLQRILGWWGRHY
jgi:hypothetical protein